MKQLLLFNSYFFLKRDFDHKVVKQTLQPLSSSSSMSLTGGFEVSGYMGHARPHSHAQLKPVPLHNIIYLNFTLCPPIHCIQYTAMYISFLHCALLYKTVHFYTLHCALLFTTIFYRMLLYNTILNLQRTLPCAIFVYFTLNIVLWVLI